MQVSRRHQEMLLCPWRDLLNKLALLQRTSREGQCCPDRLQDLLEATEPSITAIVHTPCTLSKAVVRTLVQDLKVGVLVWVEGGCRVAACSCSCEGGQKLLWTALRVLCRICQGTCS